VTKPNDDKLNQSRQPETITFRMEHRIVEELPEEAEQKTERLNVLVNQILKIILNALTSEVLSDGQIAKEEELGHAECRII
jgi:hypothetical protein